MLTGADDRAVADVVAVVPGAQPEDPLQQPLGDPAVGRQHPRHVLEAPYGGVHRLLELGDLPLVLDQLQLADRGGQLPVTLGGTVRPYGGVHGRVETAQHPGTSRRAVGQRPVQLGQVGGLHAQFGGAFAQRRAAAHPELAVAAAEELVVVPGRARPQVEHRVVPGAVGAQNQHAVRLVVAGEVREVAARPERVGGVVGAGLLRAGGDHQGLAREGGGQSGPALGVVRDLRPRGGRQLGVAPPVTHEGEESLREGRIVRLGAVRPALLRILRNLLLSLGHAPSSRYVPGHDGTPRVHGNGPQRCRTGRFARVER